MQIGSRYALDSFFTSRFWGRGLRLGAMGRTSPAFSPASLFSNGEEGAWYDPSDLSTLRQNSDGTGSVTVGDPVGYMADKSGNGNHATVSNDASRPVLRQAAGGLYYLEFDGVDDELRCTTVDLSGERSVFAGLDLSDAVDGPRAFVYGTVPNPYIGWRAVASGANIHFELLGNYELPNPGLSVIGEMANPGSPGIVRIDGAPESGVGDATAAPSSGFVIANRGNSSQACDVNYYGLVVVDRVLSVSEAAATEQYLAAKSGVTLA